MKRQLLQFIIILSLATLCTAQAWGQTATTITPTQPAAGDGSSGNPYQIGNVAELYWFAGLVNGTLPDGPSKNVAACARLTADITLNENVLDEKGDLNTADKVSFAEWMPIGLDQYTGTFDGQGFTIKGMYINGGENYTSGNVGLFGNINKGEVKNLFLTDGYILINNKNNTNMYVGSICAKLTTTNAGINGIMTNCSSNIHITMYTKANVAGGICGDTNAWFYRCSYTGTIEYKGSDNAMIGSIGGWVGNVWSDRTPAALFNYCYNTGKIINTDKTYYVLFGRNAGLRNDSQNEKNYYIEGDENLPSSSKYASRTAEQFSNGQVAYEMKNDYWGQTISGANRNEYPVPHGPKIYKGNKMGEDFYDNLELKTDADNNLYYQLNSASDLQLFANRFNDPDNYGTLLTQNARLNADIDLNPGITFDATSGNPTGGTPVAWMPIGTSDKPYTGTFDGQKHLIKGLYANDGTDAAFIHTIGSGTGGSNGTGNGSTVQNLGITTGSISGATAAAGAICVQNNGTIKNSYSLIPVSGSDNGSAGGLCGTNAGTIAYSFTTQPTLYAATGGTGIPTVTNSYSLQPDGQNETTEARHADFFKSGEITWNLNGETDDAQSITWQQNLRSENSDAYPRFYGSDNSKRVLRISLNNKLTSADGTGTTSYYMNPTGYTLPVISTSAIKNGPQEKTGHTPGWSKNEDDIYAYNIQETASSSLALYESWIANQYRLVFHPNNNGESTTTTSQSFFYSVPQQLQANTFSRTGYTFKEWTPTTDGSGELHYTDKQEEVKDLTPDVDGTFDLYAQWTPNTYTVHFVANRPQGLTGNGEMPDQILTYDLEEALRVNTFTCEGRTFIGWSQSSGATEATYIEAGTTQQPSGAKVKNLTSAVNGSITLYAIWRKQALWILFDPNREGDNTESGGEEATMTKQSFISGDSQNLTPNAYTREGYTFGGWKEKQEATTAQYADQAALVLQAKHEGEERTFYAHWNPRQYTVTVKSESIKKGGISIFDEDGAQVSGSSYTTDYRNEILLKASPRSGYQFSQWSDGNTEEERIFQIPLNGTTLTAMFAEETKTVTIQTGSGSREIQIGKDGSGLAEALAEVPNSIAIVDASLGINIPIGLSNVILKSGSMYSCARLELTDKSAFSTPVKFTAESVTYTRNLDDYTYANGTDGWTTLVVPFNGDLYADEAKIIPFGSNADTNGQYWLKTFNGGISGGTLNFAYSTKIEANKPYIIALPGDTWGNEHSLKNKTITVRASDVIIYASPTRKSLLAEITVSPAPMTAPPQPPIIS